MKRAATILLLLLLAFNWIGYRLLSGYLEHTSDLALEKKIDNADYDESSLIELKIPLNAPYLTGNSTEFERFDGEVELQGIHYKYVKRKIVDGELVLLCLPNENKNKLENSRENFFKLVNDLNHSSQAKGKNTSSFKSFVAEYKQENNCWSIPAFTHLQLKSSNSHNAFVAAGFNSILKQPPRA